MRKEILLGAALLGVSLGAFSFKTRREIGVRDKWTCQEEGCGRSFFDGWMVQAAHKDHTRNANYDKASNGRILCTEHHVKDHLDAGDTEGARLVRSTQTIRTFSWMKANRKRR